MANVVRAPVNSGLMERYCLTRGSEEAVTALLNVVLLVLGLTGGTGVSAQLSSHKSQAELEKMTPEERVQEFQSEFVRHYYVDIDYNMLLTKLIMRDGVKALPPLVRLIDAYDPRDSKGKWKEKDLGSYGAQGLLTAIDENTTRLRGTKEGKNAVEAMEHLLARMKAAGFASSDDDRKKNRYRGTLGAVKGITGTNGYDQAVQDSLRIKYKVHISDEELLRFSNYLISVDPNYPSWSEKERNNAQLLETDAESQRPYLIVKHLERFYSAYTRFIATDK